MVANRPKQRSTTTSTASKSPSQRDNQGRTSQDRRQSQSRKSTLTGQERESRRSSRESEDDIKQSPKSSPRASHDRKSQSERSPRASEDQQPQSQKPSPRASQDQQQHSRRSTIASQDQQGESRRSTRASQDQQPQSRRSTIASQDQQGQSRRSTRVSQDQQPQSRRSTRASQDQQPQSRRSTIASQDQQGQSRRSMRASQDQQPQSRRSTRASQDQQPQSRRSTRASQDQQPHSPTVSPRASQDQQPHSRRSTRASQDEMPESGRSTRASQNQQSHSPTVSPRASQDQQPQSRRSTRDSQDQKSQSPKSSPRASQDRQSGRSTPRGSQERPIASDKSPQRDSQQSHQSANKSRNTGAKGDPRLSPPLEESAVSMTHTSSPTVTGTLEGISSIQDQAIFDRRRSTRVRQSGEHGGKQRKSVTSSKASSRRSSQQATGSHRRSSAKVHKQEENKKENEAATKIQAVYRGYKTRKNANRNQPSKTPKSGSRRPSSTSKSGTTQKRSSVTPRHGNNKNRFSLKNRAATKIQATYRGHKTRKNLKGGGLAPQKPTPANQRRRSSASNKRRTERTQNDSNPSPGEGNKENEAASKIQAAFRGYKTRKDMKNQKGPNQRAKEGSIPSNAQRKQKQGSISSYSGQNRNQRSTNQTRRSTVPSRDSIQKKHASATKIQAAFKGYSTRRKLKANGQLTAAQEKPGSNKPKQGSTSSRDSDEKKAATKIQAAFRGHKTRKGMKKQERTSPYTKQSPTNDGRPKQRTSNVPRRGSARQDDDKEVEAATKIQAAFRGYKTRRNLKKSGTGQDKNKGKRKNTISGPERGSPQMTAQQIRSSKIRNKSAIKSNKQQESTKEDAAAVKIQAAYRGYKTRKLQNKDNKRSSKPRKSRRPSASQGPKNDSRPGSKRSSQDHEEESLSPELKFIKSKLEEEKQEKQRKGSVQQNNTQYLTVTNVPNELFDKKSVKQAFEKLYTDQAPQSSFVYLKSFKRVRVDCGNERAAATAKLATHQKVFHNQALNVYFVAAPKVGGASMGVMEKTEQTDWERAPEKSADKERGDVDIFINPDILHSQEVSTDEESNTDDNNSPPAHDSPVQDMEEVPQQKPSPQPGPQTSTSKATMKQKSPKLSPKRSVSPAQPKASSQPHLMVPQKRRKPYKKTRVTPRSGVSIQISSPSSTTTSSVLEAHHRSKQLGQRLSMKRDSRSQPPDDESVPVPVRHESIGLVLDTGRHDAPVRHKSFVVTDDADNNGMDDDDESADDLEREFEMTLLTKEDLGILLGEQDDGNEVSEEAEEISNTLLVKNIPSAVFATEDTLAAYVAIFRQFGEHANFAYMQDHKIARIVYEHERDALVARDALNATNYDEALMEIQFAPATEYKKPEYLRKQHRRPRQSKPRYRSQSTEQRIPKTPETSPPVKQRQSSQQRSPVSQPKSVQKRLKSSTPRQQQSPPLEQTGVAKKTENDKTTHVSPSNQNKHGQGDHKRQETPVARLPINVTIQSRPSRSILLTGIPIDVFGSESAQSKLELKVKRFESDAKVTYLKNRQIVHVTYSDIETASKAREKLQNTIVGGVIVEVYYSQEYTPKHKRMHARAPAKDHMLKPETPHRLRGGVTSKDETPDAHSKSKSKSNDTRPPSTEKQHLKDRNQYGPRKDQQNVSEQRTKPSEMHATRPQSGRNVKKQSSPKQDTGQREQELRDTSPRSDSAMIGPSSKQARPRSRKKTRKTPSSRNTAISRRPKARTTRDQRRKQADTTAAHPSKQWRSSPAPLCTTKAQLERRIRDEAPTRRHRQAMPSRPASAPQWMRNYPVIFAHSQYQNKGFVSPLVSPKRRHKKKGHTPIRIGGIPLHDLDDRHGSSLMVDPCERISHEQLKNYRKIHGRDPQPHLLTNYQANARGKALGQSLLKMEMEGMYQYNKNMGETLPYAFRQYDPNFNYGPQNVQGMKPKPNQQYQNIIDTGAWIWMVRQVQYAHKRQALEPEITLNNQGKLTADRLDVTKEKIALAHGDVIEKMEGFSNDEACQFWRLLRVDEILPRTWRDRYAEMFFDYMAPPRIRHYPCNYDMTPRCQKRGKRKNSFAT